MICLIDMICLIVHPTKGMMIPLTSLFDAGRAADRPGFLILHEGEKPFLLTKWKIPSFKILDINQPEMDYIMKIIYIYAFICIYMITMCIYNM